MATIPTHASDLRVGDRVWLSKRSQRPETIMAIEERMGNPGQPEEPGPFLMITTADWIAYRKPEAWMSKEV